MNKEEFLKKSGFGDEDLEKARVSWEVISVILEKYNGKKDKMRTIQKTIYEILSQSIKRHTYFTHED